MSRSGRESTSPLATDRVSRPGKVVLAICWLTIGWMGAIGCGGSRPSASSGAADDAEEASPPDVGQVETLTEPAEVEEIPVDVLPAKAFELEDVIESDSDAATRLIRVLRRRDQVVFSPAPEASAAIGGGLKLTLFADATARVDYLGDEPGSSSGSFRLDAEDRLHLDFGNNDPWLPMPITSSGDEMTVEAPDTEAVVQAAIEAGIPEDEITKDDLEAAFALWPLKWQPEEAEP